VWNLKDNPPIIVDEAANIRDIREIQENNNYNPTEFHWDFSKSQLTYAAPLLINIFLGENETLLSLRITSIIFSLLAIIPLFFIIKSLTSEAIAFLTTLLFSYSYYYLQFSRVGWNDIIMVVSLGLYLIWFLKNAAKNKSVKTTVVAALIASIIFNLYRGGIIYLVLSPFYFLILLKKEIMSKKTMAKLFITFVFTFLLISAPWIVKISQNIEKYNLRARVVSIKNINMPYHNAINKKGVYKYQIITSLKSWVLLNTVNGGGDENPRYLPPNKPPVNSLVKIFFYVGLITSLLKLKKTWIWISIYTLGIIFGQILTVNPPNGARGLIILPTIYIFFALGFYEVYLLLLKNKLLIISFIILAIIYSYLDFSYYQNWMAWIKV
jgi:hypothetical protein